MSAPVFNKQTRLRSLLFVPGSRPDRFDKALDAGADACIIDLEDAVGPADKDRARQAIAEWARPERPVMLRVNGADTDSFNADLTLVGKHGIDAVMLPKAEHPEAVKALFDAGAHSVIPLIETAAGLAAARQLAAAPGVLKLAFGSIDFQVDMGMADALEEELLFYRSQLVLASRLADLPGPIDGVTTAIDDAELTARDARRARRLGFSGKLCIHPRQLAPVHDAFTPDAEALAWARRVVAASDSDGALATVDGKMVDKPVLLRAQAILRDAPP